ncbi:histidine kinase [Zhihengliuella sp.]|uniref:sensor histidine kinase n=1 Tax=Zhihengliuella sp. TaxID=1954483 RepID=UPI002811A688|nr:histidine kinase [Zhihengliuella sp.]
MSQPQAYDAADVSFAELAERRRGPLLRFLRRHPRGTDALVVAFYLVSAGILLTLAAGPVPWPALGCIVLIAAALWFRRAAPFAVLALVAVATLALMVVDPFHGIFSLGLWLALYTAGTQYTWWRTAAMAILMSAVQVLMTALWVLPHLMDRQHEPHMDVQIGSLPDAILLTSALTVSANLISVGLGAAVRSSRLHQAELANWGLRVQRLAQIHERSRIAREMHDVVAHSLSVMIALSDGAAVVVRRSPDRAQEVLGELSTTGRRALRDMRRVIGVLREGSAPLEPQPAGATLNQMLEGFRVAGLPLEYSASGCELPDDAGLRLTVHRIIQESLTNVLRHGRDVTRVTVECAVAGHPSGGHAVRLRVHDDGRPAGRGEPRGPEGRAAPAGGPGAPDGSAADAAGRPGRDGGPPGSGQGLRGIAERVAIYDGTFRAGPDPAGGWSVEAELRVTAEICPGGNTEDDQ